MRNLLIIALLALTSFGLQARCISIQEDDLLNESITYWGGNNINRLAEFVRLKKLCFSDASIAAKYSEIELIDLGLMQGVSDTEWRNSRGYKNEERVGMVYNQIIDRLKFGESIAYESYSPKDDGQRIFLFLLIGLALFFAYKGSVQKN